MSNCCTIPESKNQPDFLFSVPFHFPLGYLKQGSGILCWRKRSKINDRKSSKIKSSTYNHSCNNFNYIISQLNLLLKVIVNKGKTANAIVSRNIPTRCILSPKNLTNIIKNRMRQRKSECSCCKSTLRLLKSFCW